MRIIHTSDWHLGQYFSIKDRKDEHGQFLDWLFELITKEAADVLIVAGDIFDSISPPNYAFEMYYNFLGRISATTSCDVIIVGGNHDSAATLNAPKSILKTLNVHVIGSVSDNIFDEIIVKTDAFGKPSGIICAVPFLRDRDIRKSHPGETYKDKSLALIDGIKNHYSLVKNAAVKTSADLTTKKIPIIATGHLFTEGGKVGEDEGIHEIHVGSLGHVAVAIFPEEFDYVALGHLHRPQKVGGHDHIQYSGSPIPLSFSEAGNAKQVVCITFDDNSTKPIITTISIPEFKQLKTAIGNLDEVISQLRAFRSASPDGDIWVEVTIKVDIWRSEINRTISDLADELKLDIFATKKYIDSQDRQLKKTNPAETLQNHTLESVFQKRMEKEIDIGADLQEELLHAFNEIRNSLNDDIEVGHENS